MRHMSDITFWVVILLGATWLDGALSRRRFLPHVDPRAGLFQSGSIHSHHTYPRTDRVQLGRIEMYDGFVPRRPPSQPRRFQRVVKSLPETQGLNRELRVIQHNVDASGTSVEQARSFLDRQFGHERVNFATLSQLKPLLSRLVWIAHQTHLSRDQTLDLLSSRIDRGPLWSLVHRYSGLKVISLEQIIHDFKILSDEAIPFAQVHNALKAAAIDSAAATATTVKAFVAEFLGLTLAPKLKPWFDVELAKFLTLGSFTADQMQSIMAREKLANESMSWDEFLEHLRPRPVEDIQRVSEILQRAHNSTPNASSEVMDHVWARLKSKFDPQSMSHRNPSAISNYTYFVMGLASDHHLSSTQILGLLPWALSPGVGPITTQMIDLGVAPTTVVKYLLSLDLPQTKMATFQELYDGYRPEWREANVSQTLDQVAEIVRMLMSDVLTKNLEPATKERLMAKLFLNKVAHIYPAIREEIQFREDSTLNSIRANVGESLHFEARRHSSSVVPHRLGTTAGVQLKSRSSGGQPIGYMGETIDLSEVFSPQANPDAYSDGMDDVPEDYYDGPKGNWNPSNDPDKSAVDETNPASKEIKDKVNTMRATNPEAIKTSESLKAKFSYYEELYNDFVDENIALEGATTDQSALGRSPRMVNNADSFQKHYRQLSRPELSTETTQFVEQWEPTSTMKLPTRDDHFLLGSTESCWNNPDCEKTGHTEEECVPGTVRSAGIHAALYVYQECDDNYRWHILECSNLALFWPNLKCCVDIQAFPCLAHCNKDVQSQCIAAAS